MSGSEQHATSLDAETSDWQAPLRRRPLPVPPAIAIPPPAVPLELGDAKFSAALGLGVFALSPLASRLPSPLIASAEQQKPLVAELGEPSANDASPVSPAMLMQLQHPRHDAWAFESAPGSLYTMLLHSPQYPDLSYQQQMVAACSPTMAMSPLHLSHLLQLQPDPTQQQQQLGGFGLQASPISIVSRSELHERRSAEYPQLSPMAAFQEQMSGGAGQFAPKPEANFSSPNFTDLMMFGVDGAEAMPLQTSSPASVFRYTLPTMSPHFPGITVKDITLNVLRPHFNKPMAVVAKELGVCITLMKKICRRNGLERWPHRRIRSLVNRISSLQALAANAAEPECRRFQAQIDALRTELSAVIENPNEKSRKAQADAKSRSPLSSMPPVARSFPTFPEASVDAKVAAATGAYQSASVGVRAAKLCTSTPPRVPKRESNGNKRRVGGDAVAGAHTQQPREDAATQSVALADAKRASCGVSVSIPSKKRKSGLQSLRLHAPPPIKIPCRRDIRVRRNSAPEQQHLRALFDSCSLGFGLERPSTTTNASRKRGSISSILCDPAE